MATGTPEQVAKNKTSRTARSCAKSCAYQVEALSAVTWNQIAKTTKNRLVMGASFTRKPVIQLGDACAYSHSNWSPFIFKFGDNFGVRWYGFAYVMAFICGYWLYTWLAKRGYSEMPPENVGGFYHMGCVVRRDAGGGSWGGVCFLYKPGRISGASGRYFEIVGRRDGEPRRDAGVDFVHALLRAAAQIFVDWHQKFNLCVVAPLGLFFSGVARISSTGSFTGIRATCAWAVTIPEGTH